MSIITSMRRQNAIYWPPSVVDDYGRPTTGTLVELINRGRHKLAVRWESAEEDVILTTGTEKGKKVTSRAKVFVPQLRDGTDVAVGGFLWLGDKADLTDEDDPRANDGALEVLAIRHTPNLKATEKLREAML